MRIMIRIISGSIVDKGFDIPLGGYTIGDMKNKTTKQDGVIRRLKILEGQVRGLQEMVKNDAYCIDIITQTSAVKSGLSKLEDMLLEGHLGHCVVNQVKRGEEEKAVAEILKVYQLKRK